MKLRFFGASIQWRVVYAFAASLLWWAMVELNQFWLGESWSYPFFGTGAVYAALVLVPYLPDLKRMRLLRALALLLCGAFSYWSAVSLFDSSILPIPGFVKGLSGGLYLSYPMGVSGILGAAIVGIGARLIIPLAFFLVTLLFLV